MTVPGGYKSVTHPRFAFDHFTRWTPIVFPLCCRLNLDKWTRHKVSVNQHDMPPSTSLTTTPRTGLKSFLMAILVMGAVLALIFHKSFAPDLIVFSNDGPLGAISAKSGELPSGFTGVWQDLNWIGVKGISAPPNLTALLDWIVGPYIFSKFYPPIALLFLGLSVWIFFRQLGFHPAVCVLGGLAAALNMDVFSHACWGLPTRALTLGGVFLALAALYSATRSLPWIKVALAGWAVALGIMEGFDVGAIFSVYVAAFAFFLSLTESGSAPQRITKGALRVVIVALCAGLFAAHALTSLVGTQIQGVAEMKQDPSTKGQRWDAATMWSLPKIETLRVIIPGLFGYRMEPPDESNYWGSVGQTPGVPQTRHSGSGEYAGVLVVLVALWGLYRSGQKKESPFTEIERRFIWFWGGATFLSLLFAFGRHAPFYQIIYKLPYFSTIRNPIKFMHPFQLGLLVLFGYGLQGLFRRCLEKNLLKTGSLKGQLKAWWPTASPLDKKWTIGSIAFLALCVLSWLLYFSSRRELDRYLQTAGFAPDMATSMARFSSGEVGLFIVFAALSILLLIVILSGGLSGPRAKLAWIALGVLLVVDLSRANTPWLIYWNFNEKYATNPVIDFLKQKPLERRVSARFMPKSRAFLVPDTTVPVLFEWLQHHFQYYNIQSLDIIQMPRVPEMDEAYLQALEPKSKTNIASIGRLWQLTSTRHLLGAKEYLDTLNQQIDPEKHRFRIQAPFDFALRNPPSTNAPRIEDVTAVTKAAGQYAIFEFAGALPRAKLYSQWQTRTNDKEVLQMLPDPSFDPAQTVLVSNASPIPSSGPISTNPNPSTVTFVDYAPKRLHLKSQAATPTVLLLNDKFDPDWKVTVDGKPETLLRCNFIMRGVYLSAGNHTIEFSFEPPLTGLYISLAAIAVGLILCGLVAFSPTAPEPSTASHSTDAATQKSKLEPAKAT